MKMIQVISIAKWMKIILTIHLFILQKMQEKLLVENLCLAQEYQHMQKVFLKEKDNYLCRYDKQLSLDASLRDKKQVLISLLLRIKI